MDEQIVLKFLSAFIENDCITFLSWNMSGLFRGDLRTGRVETLSVLPRDFYTYNYIHMCKVDKKLFFSPCHSGLIVELIDGLWDEQKYYRIDDKKIGVGSIRCNRVYHEKDSLFFLPLGGHAIIEQNINTGVISYYDRCYEYVSGIIDVNPTLLFSGDLVDDGKIWFGCRQVNAVFCFDTDRKVTDCYTVGDESVGFKSICLVGRDLWIYTVKGDLIQWNYREGVKSVLHNLGGEDPENNDICFFDNNIWIAGKSLYHCIKVDIKTKDCNRVNLDRNFNEKPTYGFLSIINDRLVFFPEDNEYFYEIDTKNQRASGIRFVLEGAELEKYREKRIKIDLERKGFAIEGQNESVQDYLRFLS